MIDGLKPYSDYQSARVPWAPQLPSHWRVERGKSLFQRLVRPVRENDDVVTCFRDGTVTLRKNRRTGGFTEAIKEHGYQGIRTGDLVIHAMDAFAGAAGVSDSDGKGTPVYAVCVPRESANTHYYAHIVREMARQQWILALARGIRERSTDFRFEAFATQDLPVPPPDEQAAIVRFLDHADRRIQRYIRAKQKLIKLLEEQKQAIIHQAVTRGLDPSVPMMDSGVPWIPVMPAHWRVLRLKVMASRIVDCLHATPNYLDDGEFPAIRTADIVPGEVRWQSARRIGGEEYMRWTERMDPQEGDILYSREGERYGIAACVPPDVRLCISQRMMAFRIRPEHDSRFVMRALNDPQTYVQASQDVMGATAPHVNISTIRNYGIATPPRHEQVQIAEHIAASTGGFSATLSAARREIELLRELRTRLIADVVTGQLDVRAAAAALPDAPTDEEPLDDADEPGDDDLDPDAAPEDDDA